MKACLYSLPANRGVPSVDCYACRFDRCVRAGINVQWFGLPHSVLTRECRGNAKWTLSDEWLFRRGLLGRPANAFDCQRIDVAASGRSEPQLVDAVANTKIVAEAFKAVQPQPTQSSSGSANHPCTSDSASHAVQSAVASPATHQCNGCGSDLVGRQRVPGLRPNIQIQIDFSRNTIFCESCKSLN